MNVIYLMVFVVIASMMLFVFRALLMDLYKDLKKHDNARKSKHPQGKNGKSRFKVLR